MFKKSIAISIGAAPLMASRMCVSAADKDTAWQKDHPRREQVNNRLANQNKRIKTEVKEGEVTKHRPPTCTPRIIRSAGKNVLWRPRTVVT